MRVTHVTQLPQRLLDLPLWFWSTSSTGSGVDWTAKEAEAMADNRNLRWKGRKGRRDLPLLRWRPTEGASDSTIWRAVERSPGEPIRVPLSRYQVVRESVGTSALIRLMIGWRVRANPSGPSGSPCCTPQHL